MIINTEGMSFESWAAAVGQQIGMQGDTVRVIPNEPWTEWAYRLLLIPLVSSQRAPRPAAYDDWRSWANAFNRTVVY